MDSKYDICKECAKTLEDCAYEIENSILSKHKKSNAFFYDIFKDSKGTVLDKKFDDLCNSIEKTEKTILGQSEEIRKKIRTMDIEENSDQ